MEVVRTHQQQENLKFLAYFKRKFIIHHGKRKQPKACGNNKVEFYHLRSNGSALCTRLIQIPADSTLLNPSFWYDYCSHILIIIFFIYLFIYLSIYFLFYLHMFFHSYILNVPFNNDDETGIVYAWIGSKADSEEARLIQEIAEEMFNNVRLL